ncbi:hypothetical protein GCM10011583_44560 [Streptomyces camponoticapitis]|uniref:DUF488 family protein n=1 Tax=Streptomyces camponoticapitis TaxID=1616125 RepID=A0ABQ2EHV8_9ACTN|nr:DUF488 family protein [Streptomyces camponoticapitis]GGK07774.1 hypothetical protein GCM10011583_44560 [Streptomyces camponoticapitis]
MTKKKTTRGVRVRRVYEAPGPDDGTRVLVDRLWPRGLAKTEAAFDDWLKDVAPSAELRKWYGHDPGKYEEFADRYRAELAAAGSAAAGALERLREVAAGGTLTLLTATKDLEHSHPLVLAAEVTESDAGSTRGPR